MQAEGQPSEARQSFEKAVPRPAWVTAEDAARAGVKGLADGRRVVVPFLRRAGATAVAVVVATHGDADHLGGVPAVLEAFPPALVLEPGEPLGRPLYLEFLSAVEASGAAWHAARAGDRFTLDGVMLEVLSPDSAWMATPVPVNEHGVVLRVSFGDTHLLFQADRRQTTKLRSFIDLVVKEIGLKNLDA